MGNGLWLKEKGWAFLALVAFVFCFCGRVSLAVEMSAAEPVQNMPFQDGGNEESAASEVDLEDIDVVPYVWHSSLPSLVAPVSPKFFTALLVDSRISEPPESNS